ncbi:GNAT family N-acetyltransferase [Chitinophaga rhizosphaerae]|uniref:GNAT family N-acetyltransferase n=1 Tax=Chitinophaga rhizosphaerae TaxID=1864947 RepID=UPI000F81153C|nr:GNAT family N-acetyltransferase [Chitinophaga rhizosphaerae]
MTHYSQIVIRPTVLADLESFFRFQLNEEANFLAAFTSKDPTDKPAYLEKYAKHLADPAINMQTILSGETIVGSMAKFIMHGDAAITYWLDRQHWGKGYATEALKRLLAIETTRPVFGRVAFDNVGSRRVLEKCGFSMIGTDKGFANARQAEIEELIFKLA